ncbi:uncharacterized protein LOC144872545 [Branchiostoma floridae x Branchiostoma japonicum]
MVQNKDQDTPLHKAAAGGHAGTCELLIRAGADIMAIAKYKDTLLVRAAAEGRTEFCELLIRSGADVMVQDKNKSTLLHKAAAGGHTGTCELLIHYGADVMAITWDQSTPLHKAAARSHTGTCELLIRSGADVMVHNLDRKTSLDFAKDPETRRRWKNLHKQFKEEKSYHELLQQSGGVKVNRFKVFVGGKEETGKSTLKQSLTKGLLSAVMQRLSLRSVDAPYNRTPGVDIGTFHVPGVGEVSVWDFAGQAEYAVTHSMFMDAENTVFIVLYNIKDDKKTQQNQVHWWLCFIKSCNPNRQPDVILVASHADKVEPATGHLQAALVVQTMKGEFQDHLRISDKVILMDCRRTGTPEMDRLKTLLVKIGEEMLQHQRDMPRLCAKIMEHLPKWCKKTSPKFPVMMWPDYVREARKLDRFVTEDFLKKSTRFLHHLAEVLFISLASSDPIIVLKPNWLGTDVFGRIMAPDYFDNHLNRTSEDYVTRAEIQRVFQDVADVDLVITLLQEFQLCHTFDEETYIIPGLLKQKMPDEVWKSTTEPKVIYLGKQVQCADSTDMFSSAAFPQVQTRLMREMENPPSLWRDGAKCVDRNVEGLIKLSPDGRAVNICVRSAQGDKVQCSKMLQQLENIVTDVVYECSPGTGTVENVLSTRALKEHREEFYSYSKEQISKAAAKDGTVVNSTLKFTEQINDLLCSEDEDPDTKDTKVFQLLPCEVDPHEQDIMPLQLTGELQDREGSASRNFPEPVQARGLHDAEETKVFQAVQSENDSWEQDMAVPSQLADGLQDREDLLSGNSTGLVQACTPQDTVETKVFKPVQTEVDPLSADMLRATLSIDEPQDVDDPLVRNRSQLVSALRNVEPILDHLQESDILTMEECDVIRAKSTPQDRARAMLGILDTKGEDANRAFQAVLRKVDPPAADLLMATHQSEEREDHLNRHRSKLVQAIRDVEPLLDHLQTRGVLSTEECDVIRSKPTPQERARALLDTVRVKGANARQVFKAVLGEVYPDALESTA